MKSNKLTRYFLKYNQQTLSKKQKIGTEAKQSKFEVFNKTNSK